MCQAREFGRCTSFGTLPKTIRYKDGGNKQVFRKSGRKIEKKTVNSQLIRWTDRKNVIQAYRYSVNQIER